MCWGMEISATMVVAGITGAVYAYKTKQPQGLALALFYFSLMEAIQFFSYPVINQCELPANQVLTILAYIHIAFQPFFFNFVMMSFIREDIRKKVFPCVMTVCFITTCVILFQLYPFSWSIPCKYGNFLCGEQVCTFAGNWHLARSVPYNDILRGIPIYSIAVLLLPFLYGSWKVGLYSLLIGPLMSMMLTDNPNEVPAIWCLFSVGILLLTLNKKLQKMLMVESFFWWGKEGKEK